MPSLSNAQWENFAQNIAEGMDVGKAYEEAGFAARGNGAQVNGCRLLKRAEVATRIDEIQNKAAEKVELTLEVLIEMGRDLFIAAKAAEDFTAASSTYERLAKISGHWVDRSASLSVTRLVSDRPQKPMDEDEWLSQHTPGGQAVAAPRLS